MESSSTVVSIIIRAGNATSVLYIGVEAGTIAPGFSGHDIMLTVLIWIIGPWFLVALACSHSFWVVLMDVGIMGLIYSDVGARTFDPGVSGHDISLAVLYGEPDLGFLWWCIGVIMCGWCWWT